MVTFEKVINQPATTQDVTELARAMLAEPGAWFTVRSVSGGDKDGITKVVAALDQEVQHEGHKVRLWEPQGRGFYAVTLTANGKPYKNEP